MFCPKCESSDLKVIEKRDLEAEGSIRRRRECNSCHHRFTTYERLEVPALMVQKKNGEREPYQKNKMIGGLYKALEKRPFDEAEIEKIGDELDHEIQRVGAKTDLTTKKIGDLVIGKLKGIDEVAYLRFASVYKSFDDIEAFQKELNQVICGKDEC